MRDRFLSLGLGHLLFSMLGFGSFDFLLHLQLLVLNKISLVPFFELLLGIGIGEEDAGAGYLNSTSTHGFCVLERTKSSDFSGLAIKLFLLWINI